MTADLAEIIKNFFIEKGIDISKIKFTGLDGPSAMSSDKVKCPGNVYSIFHHIQ